MAGTSELQRVLQQRGVVPAAELRNLLGVSPATLSRAVAEAGDGVVRIGKGRAVRYALPRRAPGLPANLPLFRVDPRGLPVRVGLLRLLAGNPTWVELPDSGGHLHAGLPPVLHDMAPSGYLGRRFADTHPDLELPRRLVDWSDNHRLLAIARRGEDLPGDLLVGEESFDRFTAARPVPVEPSAFEMLAEASARSGAGSSAGGEQPKFAVFCQGRHVLVKFSTGDGSPTDGRWRDLLVCEALALDVLHERGVAAARARIVDVGARRCLEVERFDRIGERGRRGMLTLAPLDDELYGRRDSWTAAAERLLADRLLSPGDARTIRLLEAFGMQIANGDRHFGNIGFFADGLLARPPLHLAPAYDMLPMDAAPHAGVLPPLLVEAPPPRAALLDVWLEAELAARCFWKRVAGDERISEPFRRSAAQRAKAAA